MTFETIRTMLVGYARVSTSEQTLNLQKDALEKLGCEKIYSDVVSGAKEERKGLQEALEYVREGDTLVVWRLDRLGRSLKHLIETITQLNNRNIGFNPTATLLEHTSLCQGFMGTSKVVSLVAGDRKIVILRGQFWAMPSSVAVGLIVELSD